MGLLSLAGETLVSLDSASLGCWSEASLCVRGLPVTIVTFTRVLPLKLKKADSKQCFYAIQTLMAVFFEIDICPAHYRQERLHKQLGGIVEEPLHCLFNDLFFVKVTKVIAV